jgi:hypothetical protein
MSDQKALSVLLSQKQLSCQQYRWIEELQVICPELHYIKGLDNMVADALS